MNILVISLAGIGDTLFATPLIHELRANFPKARIDVFVLWRGSKDILEGNPHLNFVYQKNLMKDNKGECLGLLWQLRKNKYDFSINTHPQSRVHYRVTARLINARVRVSHKYENFSVLDEVLVNRVLPQDYSRHCIENNLALLEFLGAKPLLPKHEYEIFLSSTDLTWADNFIASHRFAGHKLFGLHVGSGGTKNLALRRWPLHLYIELLNRLNHTFPDLMVFLFGGPEEEKDRERLMAETDRTRVLHPNTTNLRQAAALLKSCHCFLSVDTALMHIAAAMKVPNQIVIETPTWNRPIEPYRDSFMLVRNPAVAGRNLDYYRYDGHGIRGTDEEITSSMHSVKIDDVYKAVAKALSK